MAALREVPFGLYYGTRRCHAAVRDAGGSLCRAHRRRRHHRGIMARHRGRARLDRRPRRSRRRRLRRILPRRPRRGWPTRAGRIPTTPSSTPTAIWPKARSRWPRCRATSTAPSCLAARCAKRLGACTTRRRARRPRPICWPSGSTPRSGVRSSAPTRSRSTARSSRAACAAPTPGRCCSPASPAPERAIAGRRRPAAAAFLFRLGHPHHRQYRERATIRCRITTARSGRTTTR